MKSGLLRFAGLLVLVIAALSIPVLAQPRKPDDTRLTTSSGGAANIAAPRGENTASPNSKWRLNAVLWDQPVSSINTTAYASQDFESALDSYDIFIADDFSNASPWLIDEIFVPGDTWGPYGRCNLSCANAFTWEIYADNSGVPDGDPSGGGNPPLWHLSLPSSDSQVTLSTGVGDFLTNVTLNPSLPIALPAGNWWLSFYPNMDFVTCICQSGLHASDTTNGYDAQVINPGGAFGYPTTWTSVQDASTWALAQQDFAFRISGTAPPSGWLDGYVMDAETGGTLPPCTTAEVHAEPNGLDIPVDPVSGAYGPTALISDTYDLEARAPGYSVETARVDVFTGITTTQDFYLSRPVIEVTPASFISVTAYISQPVTHTLAINNNGHLPLGFELQERLTNPIVNANSGLERNPGIEVEPELLTQLNADEATSYMIYFRERPDLSPAFSMPWHERGWFVVNTLQAVAERAQARVRSYLDSQGVRYQSFWVDNVIVVEASDRATFNNLTSFREIAALRAHRVMQVIEPIQGSTPTNPMPMAIEPNISHVKANQVWGLGYQGEGMVVASIDTGVRYTHNALVNQYRGNLGGGSFSHDYNWLDPASGSVTPVDDFGHGSHTVGTMVGDDGGANQIGMAPAANWIACDACISTSCTGQALLTCAQWIAAPYPIGDSSSPDPDQRPHVVNNSWGDCDTTYNGWFQSTVDTWHAAGIYPVFSNGNASNCSYASPPGCNTVGNPARYGNVTGVGSTGQSNGEYASHSNWGPTDNADTVNPNGYPNLKPQVVAPGVSIRSSLNGSDSDYASWDGTSMSAPHVAALVALMWQAGPCLVGDYATTETLLEQTATPVPYSTGCGGEGPGDVPNQATGWGEINALAAVQAAREACSVVDLPWVWTDPISGTIPGPGNLDIDVTFHCTQTQDYTGTLRVIHNDPCSGDLDLPIILHCQELPPLEWDKMVGGTPWTDPMSVTVETSDTIEIVDVVTSTLIFSLTESWDPEHLTLVGYDIEPPNAGSVMTTGRSLEWEAPGAATAVTLTKWFHTEPCTWTETVIWEDIWSEGNWVTERPVLVNKEAPALWIDANYAPEVQPGEDAVFALLYGNTGGYENDVWIRNEFPPEAPFVSSTPPPDRADPAGLWVEWEVGDLARDDLGTIDVTVAIDAGLAPSTTVEIWDYIYNHVDDEADATGIRFVTPGGTCEPITGVDFAWLPVDPVTGEGVTFTAAPQPAGATPPIAYEWSFGDGHTASGNPVFHAFTVSDTFSVNVTATNACGGPAAMDHDIGVTGVPVTPTYGVDLTAAVDSASGAPGARIAFNLTVHNTGDTADTFDLTFDDLEGWTFGVTPPSVSLLPDGIALIAALVDIPPGTPDGDQDISTVTATSQGDPSVDSSADVTTTSKWRSVFLPLVLRDFEP
jgi:subtilisin family serine protease